MTATRNVLVLDGRPVRVKYLCTYWSPGDALLGEDVDMIREHYPETAGRSVIEVYTADPHGYGDLHGFIIDAYVALDPERVAEALALD